MLNADKAIYNLTGDGQGYIYWKGQQVEHYSFSDKNKEAEALRKLAEHCQQLEANGFPVNSRTATSEVCYTAPADTLWVTALCRYYSFFKDGEQVVGIFYRQHIKQGEPEVVAAYKDATGIHLTHYSGAYEAYHALQDSGLDHAGIPISYDGTVRLLSRTGLSGAELEKIINATL
jgi:hypothetical protein